MIPVHLTPVTTSPLPPTQNSLPPTFQASQVSADLANVPTGIAVLPAGSILQGFVLNRDPNGNPVLRTAYGDFLLKSSLFLKIGVDVTVKIEAGGRNFRAAITAVDGKPVEALTQHADVESSNTAATTRTIQPSNATPATTPVLKAVILNPSPEAAALPLVKPGATLKLQLSTTSFPGQLPEELVQAFEETFGTAPLPKAATSATQITPVTQPLTSSKTEAAIVTPNTTTPEETPQTAPVAFTPKSITYPSLPAAVSNLANLSDAKPLTLTGLVIGQERDGEPVISTPLGLIKITSHVTLPTGTQVTLKLSHISPVGEANATPDEISPDNPLTLARHWQNLQTLVDALGSDREGQALLANSGLTHLQSTAPAGEQALKLGNGLLFFISALKGGDLRDWIGARTTSKLEERGLGPVLKKATAEFSGLQKLAGDPMQTGWQTTFMPVLVDGQVQMVRMFNKRNRKQHDQGNEGENTRFIVEMELSQLGEMQLDGLVRHPTEKKPYLELIVRAHQPLPVDSQSEIVSIFKNATETGGVDGSLHFQWTNHFPIHPMDQALPTPPDIVA